jgi:hypothetical protein
MSQARRRRDIPLKFRVTQEEREVIEEKMAQYGTDNMAAFLRKMALDGYVINLTLPELRTISTLLLRSSNNLNQIAKRANETHRVYDTDLEEILQNQRQLLDAVGQITATLARLE